MEKAAVTDETAKAAFDALCASVAATETKKERMNRIMELARTAESSERYPDMCSFMRMLVKESCKADEELEVEQRNLLSVAYKNVVGSKRSSWRTLNSGSISDVPSELTKEYKNTVETELKAICNEVILLLGVDMQANKNNDPDSTAWQEVINKYEPGTLLANMPATPKDKDQTETVVFYLKMVGDYCRYLAEIEDPLARAYTMHFYAKAYEYAKIEGVAGLAETHPTRLGLALNYSVCHYEIMKQPDKACKLAKEAFDGAIEKLDTLNDASYKDSTLIMQLLRDNLTLWTSENTGGEDQGDEANP